MSRSQAHVSLQHQHQHQHQHQNQHQHQSTSSKYYNAMETLPGFSELVFGLGAKGGNGPSSPPMHPPPQHLGHADVVPPAHPQPNHTSHSKGEPYYIHRGMTQIQMSPWQADTGKGRGTERYPYEQQSLQHTVQQQLQQPQQKQQQHEAQQYQPSPAGGMQQAGQISSPSPVPAKQYPLPMQGQHLGAVETWCYNEHDSPWNSIWPRSQVSGCHSVEASAVKKPSPDSGAPVSPRSSRKESCSVAPRPGNGVYYEHDENAKQVSTRLVCIPEYHERSASCPTLHLTTPTPTPSRDIGRSGMHNGNYYNSGSLHEQSMAGAHGSSPQIPKTLPHGIRKDLGDPSIHVNNHIVEMRTSYTSDEVLSWGSLPRKPTTLGVAPTSTISHTSHHNSQETRLSNKSLSDLTSTAAGTWKQVSRGPPSSDVSYYHNNHNDPRPKTMEASGGHTNDAGHRDSNSMDDYESDRQPSQTPRASSSTTSSETTNTRISDSGSVTKRRSISAPKREYRCTKKDGCHAIFSCNSLRKKHEMKHTKPFTCLQRNCPKHKVGFTTSNDLRRHMKALHGYRYKPSAASPSRCTSGVTGGDGSVDGRDAAEAIPPIDAVGGWRCNYCAQMDTPSALGHVNPTKGFFSTRKDNFRNHIKRMHGALKKDSESIDEFFRRSEMECRVDSPVLLPTVPSPETPLAMDTDMGSPEANTTRGFGERRHGEQSGSGNPSFSVREDRGRLPSVEEWKGLPPPASSTQAAAHGHSRRDILAQDMVSAEVSGRSGYHSMGGSREPDRNASSRQHQQSQQNDQPRGVGGGYYHQLQRSDRENVDSQGGDYLSLGRNSNRQVEQFSGPEHPTGPSTRLASNGWTSVNRSSYNQQITAHTDGSRTTLLATHSSAVRDAGAVVGSEEFSMAHPQVHIVGAELKRLDQEEENLLNELCRVRTAQKKLRDQLERRLQSSPQATPARRTNIAVPDQDVEMLDCHPSSSWFAQAEKPISSVARTVSVSQLLNAEDPDCSAGPIGPKTSPSNTRATTHMNAVQEGAAEGLFLPPKPGSPPPPRWQFAAPTGVAGSPRGKSTTTTTTMTTTAINTPRGSTEVHPFRRQSLYNNRVKPEATNATGDGNGSVNKAFCPHCQSSFRLPCQLRKHLKRHSKPFGCTHDGCNKVFGAKNDWKRHENSQHHQLECWKCDIRCLSATPGTAKDTPDICGKCFFRKADFVKHLKTVHGNADGWVVSSADQPAATGEQIQTTLTGERDLAQIILGCHIPRYHGGAFWCGFCRKVIQLFGKVGIAGWDKRFDHIAWHFEKNNLRVKDSWMRLEEPSPEDDGKAPGVSSAKDVEESSDEEDGDMDFHDPSPKRRQTEPTPLPSYARQSQLEGVEGIPGTGRGSAETWYCCKCAFGPFLTALYVECPHCADHRKCKGCTLNNVVQKLK